MCDVILILIPGESDRLDDETLAQEFAATNIERPVEGAIACTVPSHLLHEIAQHPRVAYVRRIQAYLGSLAS